MRLANLDGRAAIVLGDEVLDVEEATGGAFSADPLEAIERSTEWPPSPRASTGRAGLERSLLGPPSPRPGQIIAIGMNYHSHALEMGLEAAVGACGLREVPLGPGGPEGRSSGPSTRPTTRSSWS